MRSSKWTSPTTLSLLAVVTLCSGAIGCGDDSSDEAGTGGGGDAGLPDSATSSDVGTNDATQASDGAVPPDGTAGDGGPPPDGSAQDASKPETGPGDTGVPDSNPCDGVACSGHGACVAKGDDASCQCDPGYHAEGLSCVVDAALGSTVTVGQDPGKASATYFYYDPGKTNAHAAVNDAIAAVAGKATATSPGEVLLENASSPYVLDNHIIARSNVNLRGESLSGARLKIAGGITPTPYTYGSSSAGWGGEDSNLKKGAIINIWTGTSNVRISNITFDGSWDDYYTSRPRGKSEFVLINIEGASNVSIDGCRFTKGADDGILCAHGATSIEVSNTVFNMIGHDCFQVWSSSHVKYHHNVCAMRTNSGVRFSGDGTDFEAYANEFYTGLGGGSGVELQTTATNVKIHHNYFHDITGAGNKYGAIGYPGQSPTGTGHQYYDNLIVNATYGIAHVPPSSVSENNIILDCDTAISGGTSTDNIATESGYVFTKSGTKTQGNTYWTVDSGPLAPAFAGIKVGIDPGLPN